MNAKTRILIGEDDPNILKVTKVRLEYEGYEVTCCSDGEEVIRKTASIPAVDLILLDIKLPKRDGYEVCRILKANAATASIPIIAFSVHDKELHYLAKRGQEAGFADWIGKPFQSQELMDKIQDLLRKKGGSDGG